MPQLIEDSGNFVTAKIREEAHSLASKTAATIRQRLRQGATVEPGPWEFDGELEMARHRRKEEGVG